MNDAGQVSDVVILVPRRSDNGERDRLWRFCRAWWANEFPEWPIVEGYHNDGPFNRSAAINRAAEAAGNWNVAVIIDGDVLPTQSAIHEAVKVARSGVPACGFTLRRHLSKQGTAKILNGYRGSWTGLIKQDFKDSVSGAFVLSRDLWDTLGGFDELFVGWGWEDVAFKLAAETMAGEAMYRATGNLWHLWHPNSPERADDSPQLAANKERGRRYKAAKMDRDAMMKLISGAENTAADYISSSRWSVTIPPIFHRTVPAETPDEVESFWKTAKTFHPDWEFKTWRDPIDRTEFPETSRLWDRCKSGAQMAGLIRLEALWHHGGVYIDSDVELYRPLDALLGLAGFAGWEDAKVVPDAVMGFAPQHPAVAEMLELACASIERGEGAWLSGPGVTTRVLPGRKDVLLLPPGSLYPYHYTERDRRDEDHARQQPWALMAHHWHHSWRGK